MLLVSSAKIYYKIGNLLLIAAFVMYQI